MSGLFRAFLDDPVVYREAQQFWERLFRASLPRYFPAEQLWINKFNNPDNDGNPMLTAVCRPLRLAARVIQQPVGEPGDLDLDCWVDTAAVGSRGAEIQELVIACCPSLENVREVKRLLHDWFRKGRFAALLSPGECVPWEGQRLSYSPELCLQ